MANINEIILDALLRIPLDSIRTSPFVEVSSNEYRYKLNLFYREIKENDQFDWHHVCPFMDSDITKLLSIRYDYFAEGKVKEACEQILSMTADHPVDVRLFQNLYHCLLISYGTRMAADLYDHLKDQLAHVSLDPPEVPYGQAFERFIEGDEEYKDQFTNVSLDPPDLPYGQAFERFIDGNNEYFFKNYMLPYGDSRMSYAGLKCSQDEKLSIYCLQFDEYINRDHYKKM